MTTSTPTLTDQVRDIFDAVNRSSLGPQLFALGGVTNQWGGMDFLADNGTTLRIADNDGCVRIFAFTGGRAMLLESTVTFDHAPADVIAATLGALYAMTR